MALVIEKYIFLPRSNFKIKTISIDIKNDDNDCIPLYANHEVHNHYTRQQQNLHICVAKDTFARKCIRYSLPNLINETSSDIIDKVFTHSVNGFKLYVKNV